MRVKELINILDADILSAKDQSSNIVEGVYAGDLLSMVMSNTKKNDVWITVHTHLNIIAVGALNELSAIIIPHGIMPEENTLRKAEEEKIPVITTKYSAYEICVRIHEYMVLRRR